VNAWHGERNKNIGILRHILHQAFTNDTRLPDFATSGWIDNEFIVVIVAIRQAALSGTHRDEMTLLEMVAFFFFFSMKNSTSV
jgi:hypothetical protein